MGNIVYRKALPSESALVLQFIRELAEYEKLLDEVVATEEDIKEALFGENPKAFCVFADYADETVGFALCFYNFSTFKGKPGIFLEDLFVKEEFRGRGIGKGFFNYLTERAINDNCSRIQWEVLDWNEPSIEFYKSLGAKGLEDWVTYRLDREGIEKLAKEKF